MGFSLSRKRFWMPSKSDLGGKTLPNANESLRKNANNKYIVVFLCGSNLHVQKIQNSTMQYNKLCLNTMRIKATSLWSCNLLATVFE